MKDKNKYIKMKMTKALLLLITVIMFLPSCQDRLDEMNNNPNAITEVPPGYLFTTAVRGVFRMGDAGGYQYGDFDVLQVDYASQYAHLAVSDYGREIDKYNESHITGDAPNSIFNQIYGGSIKYCNDILITTAIDGEHPNELQHALASVVAVMNFALLTDLFGDIPYFEGGLGKEGVFLPKYDKQEDIYADMVERLKNNITVMKNGDFTNAFPDTDPMYDNDKESWIRFANSLRLRIAMRARFVSPAKYEPIIAECLAEDLIEKNETNATLQHWDSDNGELRNPWHKRWEERYLSKIYFFSVSEKYVEFLKSTNDPRLEVMVDTAGNGEYIGLRNGLTNEAYAAINRKNTSSLSPFVLAKDQPLYLMTASEIWFLRAEAALFGLVSGDANQLYQQGITMAMLQWDIPLTDIAEYLSNSTQGALSGTTEEQFEQISEQMWLAYVPNYSQAWINIRRTGYPVIDQRTGSDVSQGVTNGYMPSRMLYSYSKEFSVNGKNLQEAIDRLPGGDKMDSRVWWDVRD